MLLRVHTKSYLVDLILVYMGPIWLLKILTNQCGMQKQLWYGMIQLYKVTHCWMEVCILNFGFHTDSRYCCSVLLLHTTLVCENLYFEWSYLMKHNFWFCAVWYVQCNHVRLKPMNNKADEAEVCISQNVRISPGLAWYAFGPSLKFIFTHIFHTPHMP